jgi:pimeloyl-ACP methyl ester carboxylesterase
MGREFIDQMARAFISEQENMPSTEVLVGQLDALDKHDALEDLRTISVPTLVFGAKMDVMVPYLGSKEIAEAIPGAEFVTFETGHGCTVEEMDAVNKVVEDFLAQF